MTDFDFLLANPELAKTIKLEITGSDLLSLANTLVKAGRINGINDTRKVEPMLTIEEVCAMVRRDRTTLNRWHNDGVLKHNSLGLYKQSDITNFLNK